MELRRYWVANIVSVKTRRVCYMVAMFSETTDLFHNIRLGILALGVLGIERGVVLRH